MVLQIWLALVVASEARFAIEDASFGLGSGLVRLKVLRNVRTGEFVEVCPDLGGRTEALVLRGSSGLKEVLLHHNRNATAARANNAWKGDILLPYANRVGRNGSYHLDGKAYQLEANEDRRSYGYGKVALHGYLWKKQLRVQSAIAEETAAKLELAYDFRGDDPGYPFPLGVVMTYTLDAHGFSLTFTARHRGFQHSAFALPITASWHSYFVVPEIAQAVVELDRCSPWNHINVTNNSNIFSDLIPSGTSEPFTGFNAPIGGHSSDPIYWDDEFKATASITQCPELKVKVWDHVDADEAKVLWADFNFRWIQVFTGTLRNFGENGVAIEAMSGQADAFNNMEGLRLLQPGEVWQGTMGVRLEETRPAGKHGLPIFI